MCTVILDSAVSVALRDMNETFTNDDKIDVNCLLASLERNHFVDEVFKKVVYEQANHLSAAEKEEKLRKLEKNFTIFIVNQTADCLDGRKFLKTMLDGDSGDDYSETEKFCARKFVIYKNILDPSDYKINVNLDKIDPRKIDCNNEMAKLRRDFDEIFNKDLSESQRNCFAAKTKNTDIFESLIWVKVLQDINALDALKEKEQKRFDEFFPNFFRNFSLCQLE